MSWWSRNAGVWTEQKKSVPKGLWLKCEACAQLLFEGELEENLQVCPKCGFHMRMPTAARMALVMDEDSFVEADADLRSTDPLEFRVDGVKYKDAIKAASRKAGGAADAYVAGGCTIDGHPVEIGFFVFEFMGGSMGSVVGEKITRQFERGVAHKRPAILFSASGGARMQEGVLSLMQMAKTSAARSRLRESRVPYVVVLLHPTTGGVAASFAMLGDVIMAEPNALIGFAGPRVIEQTIRQQLPEGFQRSEFLLEHGMIDFIVDRKELKATLARTLRWFGGGAARAS
jgi:acetyl-CoA carboxylase carboxyl transferase subunit beta